jgi:hypothetical protein
LLILLVQLYFLSKKYRDASPGKSILVLPSKPNFSK